jgi:hypothetical protein
MTTPYARATSGQAARGEITKLLLRFGCQSIGFMDDYEDHSLLLAFKHRGRQVHLRASAKGWAQLYLKENPKRGDQRQREMQALEQGQIAVNSILRDWVRGQVTAIETGVLSFEAVFMPYMLLPNGQSVLERIKSMNLLENPPPK